MISLNLINNNHLSKKSPENTNNPTYQCNKTITVIYSPTGELNYKLVASHIQHFIGTKITKLHQPTIIIYHENQAPTWKLSSDTAKLTNNKILYLYGHVQVQNISNIFQIKQLTTNQAVLNLITQDVFSDEKTNLYGNRFHSIGMKLRGNFKKKTLS